MKVNKLVKVYAAQRLAMHSMLVQAMAVRVDEEETGIPHVCMWISSKEGARHGPRVKVSNVRGRFAEDDTFTIKLDGTLKGKVKLSKKDLDRCIKFVAMNRDVLNDYWKDSQMSISKLLKRLKKVSD